MLAFRSESDLEPRLGTTDTDIRIMDITHMDTPIIGRTRTMGTT